MYKEDLALNNLQWQICHKTKPIAQSAGTVEYTDPTASLQRDKPPTRQWVSWI